MISGPTVRPRSLVFFYVGCRLSRLLGHTQCNKISAKKKVFLEGKKIFSGLTLYIVLILRLKADYTKYCYGSIHKSL